MEKNEKEKLPEKLEIIETGVKKKEIDLSTWKPKTALGRKVKLGLVKDINEILESNVRILESEIVDALVKDLEMDLIKVGQSKGKFGGGKRTIWRQTQKKSKEGNKTKFSALAVVGNKDGIVGIGLGKAKETVPAREGAVHRAKISIIRVKRGCGSWECGCGENHSIPLKVEGKCGSVRIKLMPAPKGTGLSVESECQKVLKLAGIKDVYSKTKGQTRSKINMIKACIDALQNLGKMKKASLSGGTA